MEDSSQQIIQSAPQPSTPPQRSKKSLMRSVVGLVIVALVSLGFGYLGGHIHPSNNTTTQTKSVVLSNEGEVISGIAKNVGQSVVSVNVISGSASGGLFGGSGVQEGAGTGIILTSSGLIITNRHVVPAGTTSVSVTLSDGTTFKNVTVVGRTSESNTLDIAFLKINDTKGKTLVPAQIGDSSKTQVGDPVVAIGNALGQFQNTVTQGVISGYGRSIQATDSSGNGAENLADLFQTDAAINEGNSGGPLVNLSGQVIGINTAIAGDAQNIGFAIPINDVSGVIKSVENTGKLTLPYLGVIYIPITSDIASQYNLSVTSGAYVPPASLVGQDTVIAGGPADKAGIKEGDIITKVDNTPVDSTHSLTGTLDQHSVGDKVTLTIIRGGKQITVSVTLGAAPSD